MTSVIVSFDTEDFVTPESDDALGRLCDALTSRGICGCFDLVGDKVRGLRQRGRQDVITRVLSHEIDYHSNDHHFFPLLAPTIEGKPWDESLAWVLEHEARGVAELEETFGRRPVAWVKTDSHWTPQSLQAFRLLGMRVYGCRHFDAGSPRLWWYMNLLTIPWLGSFEHYIQREGTPRDLLKAELADFEVKAEAAGPDGVLNYGTHPCMWSCSVFYDIHNVKRRGHPPPKHKWQPAPLLPDWRIKRDRQFLLMFLDELKRQGVEFINCGQLHERYAEPPNRWLTQAQLGSLARPMTTRFAAAKAGGGYYNVAEVLAALCYALARYRESGTLPARVPVRQPIGPVETPRTMKKPLEVCGRALLGAARRADDCFRERGRVPAGVDVGGHHFPPAQLLRAAAENYLAILAGKRPPGAVLQPGPDCPEEATLLEGARIGAYALPTDYHPAGLLELGRLQSWTLKPAV